MMKFHTTLDRLVKGLALGLSMTLSVTLANAHPYASACTNNSGTIQFYMNESGANVTVTYEDGSTNASFNGITTGTNVPAGLQSFSLGGHVGYSISCQKLGTGTPFQISSDANPYCIWNTPRGVDANKNPKIGSLFGRVYIGDAAANATHVKGIYALTPDLSTNALLVGTNSFAGSVFANSGTSGPYRMTVAPDNSLYVSDFSTAAGTLWQFGPNFEFTNLVLNPVGENQGIAAGIHGDPIGVFIKGSIATSNLVIYTSDPGLGAPASATKGFGGEGQTGTGDYNNLFRYDIGAGPLPWTNPPNFAVSLGLPGFFDSQVLDLTVEANGYLVGMFRRANLSDGNIQVFNTNGVIIYTSLHDGGDVFTGANGSGAFSGVRISPDGRWLATVTINNEIEIANLTNGVPDEATLIRIPNTPSFGNARGMCWDAADNLYACSSGQTLLRYWSLGDSSTAITTNDATGTNGGFVFMLPPVNASVVATQATASQNYVNSTPAGTPTPGVFTISLNTNQLSAPVTVTFKTSGTAVYLTNYTINLGTDANGVLISSNSVTFPASTAPSGNWTVNVQITPTANPVTGPTLTVGLALNGGPNYLTQAPFNATVSIINTGPQMLILSPASTGTTMNRGVPHDYAEFVVTRYGDPNGPGNSSTNVTPTSYTVTNFTYLGTAVFPVDYTAASQRIDPAGDGVPQSPTDGSPGIVINPGNATVIAVVGNPVAHPVNLPPTNATIIISLTNSVGATNLTSSEGFSYSVSNNSVTLTEFDNTIGPETVIWSDSLNSAADSANWTLTFASTALSTNTVLPVVIPNYSNGVSSIVGGGSNDFRVAFGSPVANDSVSPSPAMVANGWTNALRMTVNKDGSFAVCGVNLFPQGVSFGGNYALRFDMYLSLYSGAINNQFVSATLPREFAAFGINTRGTNCDWRLAAPIAVGTGSSTTNADGVWFAIDAGVNSQTPADFDGFASPALPNAGVGADIQSNTSQSQNGVFKHPPFASIYPSGNTLAGGEPVNQWVSVSVEVTGETNVSLFIDRAKVLTSFSLASGGNYTSGKPMLGYLDPVNDESDNTAFALYSNVRVVELSPNILSQASSLIVTQGANVSFTSIANLATAPLTNTWYVGNTGPLVALQTDTANATNLTSTLSFSNVQSGTNYVAVASDSVGSVTGIVATLEVITGPTNVTVSSGQNVQFAIAASGQAPPTSYHWKTNGVNLANSAHYAGGVTNATLTINNVQLSDAGTYSIAVTNAAGFVTPSAVLTVLAAPPYFSSVAVAGTNAVLDFTTPNTFDNTGSFTLQSSIVVTGPYTNTPGLFTGSNGTFQVIAPVTTNATMFYRLKHN